MQELAEPGDCGSGSVDATMGWQSVLELAAQKVSFGSHTVNHEILPRIPLRQAESEISNSKQAIENELGKPCSLFAYPNGDASPEIRQIVAQAGYELAFVNRPGAWLEDTDPLLIPRVNIWEGMLVGISGRFSRAALRYAAVWKVYRLARMRAELCS